MIAVNMQEIRRYARQVGVVPRKLRKTELIRTIQKQEGNFDCFATASTGNCSQSDCLWKDDCFINARKNS
jgi:hypothetical protein